MIKRVLSVFLIVLLVMASTTAFAEEYRVAKRNKTRFTKLLDDMLTAARQAPDADETILARDLVSIRKINQADYEVALSIVNHWERTFLTENYPFNLYNGRTIAEGLEKTGIRDVPEHAFVVLGYALEKGEMADELIGRCDAAAAVAKAFPNTIIVCSGGATGEKNPKHHTEAGLMKAYLTEKCGLDAGRIYTDEKATTTVENAVNTMRILREQQVETITLVTSAYHQRWSQVIYNAMSAMYQQLHGYSVEIISNYCYDIEPSNERFKDDARMATRQLSAILKLK